MSEELAIPEFTGKVQDTRFKPGQSGNPAGRPRGTRNKLGDEFLKAFLDDFMEYGREAIEQARIDDPATYLRVAASLLPKEINITQEDRTLERLLQQHSIAELGQLIDGLVALGSTKPCGENAGKEIITIEPDSVHTEEIRGE